MADVNKKWTDGMLRTEDWWAVWLGLFMFGAGLMSIWGLDLVGWMAKPKTWEWTSFWSDPSWKHLLKVSHGKAGKAYESLSPFWGLIVTWLVFGALTGIGAYFQKLNVQRFVIGFAAIFFITYASWITGHEAHFKALKAGVTITQPEIYGTNVFCTTKVHKCTKKLKKTIKKLGVGDVLTAGQARVDEMKNAGQKVDKSDPLIAAAIDAANKVVKKQKKTTRLSWGLQLGGGFSYILSLVVGLVIGNFMRGFAGFLKEAAKPEWFIKTAIVYLGVKLGKMTLQHAGQLTGGAELLVEMALAGAAAAFVAYLIFWPIVYLLGRRVFNLRRDASAVLSSGISICGVSAAIATAGAIRAKPILPLTVSMLIVIFAMFELIVLPGFYSKVFPDQPIVNAAAMGMTVKTDGADAAAGAVLEEMMVNDHYKATIDPVTGIGERWEEDFILQGAILTKVWIDVFIGVWAFVLSAIWLYKVERKEGERVPVSEIWFRFPKFVLGYFIAWLSYIAVASVIVDDPKATKAALAGAKVVQGGMRKMMFMITFVAIGVITDFSKLKGMGKLAALYAIALFAIIAPIAYTVSYIFHHGMMPPVVTGG